MARSPKTRERIVECISQDSFQRVGSNKMVFKKRRQPTWAKQYQKSVSGLRPVSMRVKSWGRVVVVVPREEEVEGYEAQRRAERGSGLPNERGNASAYVQNRLTNPGQRKDFARYLLEADTTGMILHRRAVCITASCHASGNSFHFSYRRT